MDSVLIVGAGPVGLTLACELARYGVPIRIVDKAANRTDKSKALVVWSRTLELLDRGGGAAPFIEAGFKVNAANIVVGEKDIGHVNMAEVKSPYPFGLMLPQYDTERLLEERLASLGIHIERQVELARFSNNHAGVDAVLRHADGREEALTTPWLAGCDGAHSAVRHGLDAPFTGETMDADFLLADVHMKGYRSPDSEVTVYWHRDGLLVIFPIVPGRYRIIADTERSPEKEPVTPSLADVQKILDDRGGAGMVASDPVWLAGFRINGRKVSSYRFGRTFLLGDAAHVHSPAGGQGMNTGMQDAFNLAWKLALVVHGRCAQSLLDSFSPERSAVGDQVLKAADRLTVVGTLRNPVAQALRNVIGHTMLGFHTVEHAVAEGMTEVSVGYPHSPLNGPSGHGGGPGPGERVNPVTGEVPPGSGGQPLFALYARPSRTVSELVGYFEGLVDPQLRPPLQDCVTVVRPDGYVCARATGVQDLVPYLEGLRSGG